jgi:2-polyprenyl-3-methyl-5-hydroxy-6-metoxy-1,4-benzoquinol methylase
MTDSKTDQERWKHEAEFFDRDAEQAMARLKPVDPRTIHRYGALRRRRFNKEFRFRVLGDLAGKKVLDVGCGDGINAINLAKLGATVTGIDISPGAIALATKRAEINGVSDRCTFICQPFETAELAAGAFDIVWGDAILHHLLHDLDAMVGKIVRYAKPGGIVMFGEPVALSRAWRKFRLMLPIETYATPDERPLEQPDLDIVSRHLNDMQVRYFLILARVSRFMFSGTTYEGSGPLKKGLFNLLTLFDYAVLSLPFMRGFAASAVIYGRAK